MKKNILNIDGIELVNTELNNIDISIQIMDQKEQWKDKLSYK